MRVGLLLPSTIDLGLIRRARRWSQLIASIRDEDGAPWLPTVGLPHMPEKEWRAIERDIRAGNATTTVRHLQWEAVPVDQARRMFPTFPQNLDLDCIEEVFIPRDWGWNFQDCDALIVFADPGLGAILPLLPTLFYCTDLAVRVVPELAAQSIDDPYWDREAAAFRMWRQSRVATADASTIEDIVSYAGVRRDRIDLLPNLFDMDIGAPGEPAPVTTRTLCWLFGSPHLDDAENAVKGAQIYLSENGGLELLFIHDAVRRRGQDTSCIYDAGLPSHVAEYIYGLSTERVSSDRELRRLLRRSAALWSSRIAGGEAEALLLAAETGTAFVGADYATNRRAAMQVNTSTVLYPLNDPLAIADALHRAEASLSFSARETPARSASTDDRREAARSVLLRLRDRDLED